MNSQKRQRQPALLMNRLVATDPRHDQPETPAHIDLYGRGHSYPFTMSIGQSYDGMILDRQVHRNRRARALRLAEPLRWQCLMCALTIAPLM
jgi:hypothetical protein